MKGSNPYSGRRDMVASLDGDGMEGGPPTGRGTFDVPRPGKKWKPRFTTKLNVGGP